MSSGYTLLELLVVIAIIAFIAALAAPSAIHTIDSATINSDARRLAANLRHLQRLAGERQEDIRLTRAGSAIALDPHDASPALHAENAALSEKTDALVYFADGTSSGGTLALRENGMEVDIAVAWLTGAVTIGGGDDAR